MKNVARPLIILSLALVANNARAVLAPDHIVVVLLENRSFGQIIGSSEAPYINGVLVAQGALLTNSHAIEHPSQPNYLDLFSGSNQSVTTDAKPPNTPFSTPNLGAKLIAAGLSFATFSESLPYVGFKGYEFTDTPGVEQYVRRHNPAVNWQADDAPASNHLPASTNLPFTMFPTTTSGFESLPTVSFVIPNEQHNMHDSTIRAADDWLRANLESYRSWAMSHNNILLLTFDEDAKNTATNHITTIFVGDPIIPGQYSESSIENTPGSGVDHFNILRTIEHRYGLGFCNAATDGSRKPITDIFVPASDTFLLNASTRARIGPGDDVLIAGFIVQGPATKRIVLRGIGPSTDVNGAIADPVLRLYNSDGSIAAANDDWQNKQRNAIETTGLAPRNPREAAIVVSLSRGAYTAVLSSKNSTSGTGLVELYDVEQQSLSEIRNLSTRGRVGAGDDQMIGGVIVKAPETTTVLVRALGPSLRARVSDALVDPMLTLYDGNGSPIAANDNWQETQRSEIESTGLAPTQVSESAILIALPSGPYTALLGGKNVTSGIALLETYKLD